MPTANEAWEIQRQNLMQCREIVSDELAAQYGLPFDEDYIADLVENAGKWARLDVASILELADSDDLLNDISVTVIALMQYVNQYDKQSIQEEVVKALLNDVHEELDRARTFMPGRVAAIRDEFEKVNGGEL
jgi:hypothetical protein